MEKENAVTNSLIFVQNTPQKMNKIAKNRHNCYNIKGCLRLLYFTIFEYRQIWLNIFLWMIATLEQHHKIEKEKNTGISEVQMFRLMLSTSGPNRQN
jgi:hypothetical protein